MIDVCECCIFKRCGLNVFILYYLLFFSSSDAVTNTASDVLAETARVEAETARQLGLQKEEEASKKLQRQAAEETQKVAAAAAAEAKRVAAAAEAETKRLAHAAEAETKRLANAAEAETKRIAEQSSKATAEAARKTEATTKRIAEQSKKATAEAAKKTGLAKEEQAVKCAERKVAAKAAAKLRCLEKYYYAPWKC